MQNANNNIKTIELLAPAKDLACGIAAINHGADAVYIGAAKFGARHSAGNSVEDIAMLCEYAHKFGAKVHVTVNTIIYENELEDMLQLICELEKANVDALLIQDMGLLKMCKEQLHTKMSLHASTQCDSRTIEKVRWLASLGFERVVLARELSVKEIANIHKAVPEVELEAFVHGALCVSYSGICYASQYCFNRSANRGSCAQFCRMAFDLIDSNGTTIEHQRYLLSLKDMNLIDNLEALMRSGACAFKIEGRLKDVNYVKNVVSAYSQRLNEIIAKYPNEFQRASFGRVEYNFTPNLNKTFNRGYTHYFVNGRQQGIFSPNTPKALGEYVGKVKEIRHNSFNVSSTASFSNGDGLCFIKRQPNGESKITEILEGFRVNKATGNRLFPYKMPQDLKPGVSLYRNQDQAFEKKLSSESAVRLIPITMQFEKTHKGYSLAAHLSNIATPKIEVKVSIEFEHQKAKKPQHDNIIRQLTKLGNTIYFCDEIEINENADQFFLPSSVLTELRRNVIEAFEHQLLKIRDLDKHNEPNACNIPVLGNHNINPSKYKKFPYLYNVSNSKARAFYTEQGINVGSAFECMDTKAMKRDALIMQCRHCIRYSLGYCLVHGGKVPTWREPLYLVLGDKRRFRLEFDCKDCQMNIYAE